MADETTGRPGALDSSLHLVHPREEPGHQMARSSRKKSPINAVLEALLGAPWDEAEFLNRDLAHELALADLYRRYAKRFRIPGLETGMVKLAQLAERQAEAIERHLRLRGAQPTSTPRRLSLRPNPLEVLGQLWEFEKDQAQAYHEQMHGCDDGAAKRLIETLYQTKQRQMDQMQRVLARI